MASADWLKLTLHHAAGMDKHLDSKKRLSVNHSNADIDKTKSHLNIMIGCTSYSEALQAMKARVKEVDTLYPPLKKKKSDERVIAEMIEVKCPAEIVTKGSTEFIKSNKNSLVKKMYTAVSSTLTRYTNIPIETEKKRQACRICIRL